MTGSVEETVKYHTTNRLERRDTRYPLSIESRMRTIYPVDCRKGLIQNSEMITEYDRCLKKTRRYNGRNIMNRKI